MAPMVDSPVNILGLNTVCVIFSTCHSLVMISLNLCIETLKENWKHSKSVHDEFLQILFFLQNEVNFSKIWYVRMELLIP